MILDKIYLKGLEIYAYHGVNIEEKEEGQRFVLDITLEGDLTKAKNTDKLSDTINYSALRKTVTRVFTAEKYDLLERAAKVVCDAVLAEHPMVEKVRLKLKKPNAPMNAVFEYAAVEIEEAKCR